MSARERALAYLAMILFANLLVALLSRPMAH
jgi:hypothetical protein